MKAVHFGGAAPGFDWLTLSCRESAPMHWLYTSNAAKVTCRRCLALMPYGF